MLYIHVCSYIYMYIYMCVCVYIHTCIHASIHVNIRRCIYLHGIHDGSVEDCARGPELCIAYMPNRKYTYTYTHILYIHTWGLHRVYAQP
jgi:hypothetical protein